MSEIERKTQFYWASIDGAEPEPVEVCTIDGRKACYTLGCPDPFFLDEDGPVRLCSSRRDPGGPDYVAHFTRVGPLDRPVLPTKDQTRHIIDYDKPNFVTLHRWRGPR